MVLKYEVSRDDRYLNLKVGFSGKFSIQIQPVFITDNLPKLCANLVAALSNLKMDDLSHLYKISVLNISKKLFILLLGIKNCRYNVNPFDIQKLI